MNRFKLIRAPIQEFHEPCKALTPEAFHALHHTRLRRVFFGDYHLLYPCFARCEHDRQNARNALYLSVQAQFSHDQKPFEPLLRDHPGSCHNGDRDRQVKARAALSHIRG